MLNQNKDRMLAVWTDYWSIWKNRIACAREMGLPDTSVYRSFDAGKLLPPETDLDVIAMAQARSIRLTLADLAWFRSMAVLFPLNDFPEMGNGEERKKIQAKSSSRGGAGATAVGS